MNGKIEANYTAKGAMQRVVEYMSTNTLNIVEIITIEQLVSQEAILFLKMAMRFLHRNQARAFLFAETEAELRKVKMYIEERYSHIVIVESATMDEHGISDDMILNRVNGAETDCIVSVLSSSVQEDFLARNKTLLNARVWLGFDSLFSKLKEGQTVLGKLKKFLVDKF